MEQARYLSLLLSRFSIDWLTSGDDWMSVETSTRWRLERSGSGSGEDSSGDHSRGLNALEEEESMVVVLSEKRMMSARKNDTAVNWMR